MKRRFINIILILILVSHQQFALAGSPQEIVQHYLSQAKREDKRVVAFSQERGQDLYFRQMRTKNGDISCSTCHTKNAKSVGRTRANKNIEPLAPIANDQRFSDLAKVEKWFARNCDDVFRRACTTQEKGDFVTYLSSIK